MHASGRDKGKDKKKENEMPVTKTESSFSLLHLREKPFLLDSVETFQFDTDYYEYLWNDWLSFIESAYQGYTSYRIYLAKKFDKAAFISREVFY